MTRNKLTEALDAIDRGESPFNDPPLDTPIEPIEPIEPSVAPSLRNSSWNAPYEFGVIPATDHDALEAQLTSELADGVEKVIATREATHGDYDCTARVSRALKKVAAVEALDRAHRGQPPLTDRQHESIDMICVHLARIISGKSDFPEHWIGIQGYAKIAIDE